MKLNIYNQEGKRTGEIELPEGIFSVKWNPDLVHQAVTIMQSNQRVVRAHTKQRGEVRGGGKKPWRQKGTGRARHGSIRSPIWKGGGVVFGPRSEKNYKKELPIKMRRKAILCVLSQKARDNEIIVLDGIKLSEPKTRFASLIFGHLFSAIGRSVRGGKNLKLKKSSTSLLALPKSDQNIIRAVRNLPYAQTIEVRNLNILDLLNNRYLVLPKESIDVLAKQFKTV